MNFSKYLPFQYLGVTWRRLALFFITLFTIVSLQHFISEPILSASSPMSSSTSSAIASSIVAQASPSDSTSPSNVPELTEEQKAIVTQIYLFAGIYGFFTYVFCSLCLMKIADKLELPNSWLAWLPIGNIWVMVRAAGKPGWWLLWFFVPFVNIVIALIVLFGIPANLGKSSLMGLLVFLPILGVYLYYGLLAFT